MLLKRKDTITNFCIFALPGIFVFAAVVIVPFVYGVYLTGTDWDGLSTERSFVGLENYRAVFDDAPFWSAVLLTLQYVVCTVILVNIIAFLLAWVLTSGVKAQNFLRAAYFTPNLIGGVILGFIWQFIFTQAVVRIGDLTGASLFSTSWLSDPTKAFWAMVIVTVWQLSGYMMLIYVAGFIGLPVGLLKAASLDGASGFAKMKEIILPLMMPSIVICLFLTTARAFMVYDINLSLTNGGPFGSTTMAAMYVYEQAFSSRNFGVGQAEALVLFAIVAIVSGIQVYIGKRKEVEA